MTVSEEPRGSQVESGVVRGQWEWEGVLGDVYGVTGRRYRKE